jgi:ubiquitin C-terminal hydrolase
MTVNLIFILLIENKDQPSQNCATYLEKPESRRNESNFVGLFNPGNFCYMNSALQVIFMNPLFRQFIYNIHLFNTENYLDPENKSALFPGQKHEILFALQKLFIQFQKYDVRAIETKELTESFKWNSGEHHHQQDSQEFIHLLVDVLEKIFCTTPYEGHVNNFFRILSSGYMVCTNCNFIKNREEFNLDIVLPVKGFASVTESLDSLYNNYELIDDFKCDACEQKVTIQKGSKLTQLPANLNLVLNKFEFDMNTLERVKITDKYEFPLEINMKPYLSQAAILENGIKDEDLEYELFALIIHRGTPYSGHYFSYIRDINHEGVWNLKELENGFRSEPLLIEEETKKEEVKSENPNKEEVVKKEEPVKEDGEEQEGKGKKENKKQQNKSNNNNQGKKNQDGKGNQNQGKGNQNQGKGNQNQGKGNHNQGKGNQNQGKGKSILLINI